MRNDTEIKQTAPKSMLSPEEIHNGNILIARSRFSGLKWKGIKSRFYDGLIGHKISDLQYHCKFDWLMPIKNAIVNLPEVDYIEVYSEPLIQICDIYLDTDRYDDPSFKASTEIEIESLFIAIVSFIKWFNTKENEKLINSVKY